MNKLNIFLNALAKFIQTHEVFGKYRFYEATKHKYNRKLITYTIAGAEFSIPWDQWCFWKNYGPENYYLEEMLPFTAVLNNTLNEFDFIDLGADVGVVSALINKHCKALKTIIAVEPNPYSFEVLQTNLSNISNKHYAINQAISDFNGSASFSFNNKQGSDHEGHLQASITGSTKVTSLDQLITDINITLNKNIAIKIDVEGQELATFNGCKQVLRDADKAVVLLELHPEVLTRDNQTAEQIFSAAEQHKNFTWFIPLLKMQQVDRERLFFEQVPIQQYDVIGISR
jgi:FkbM family methyltransferase